MSKRSANDSLDKLKNLIEGNNSISLNLQSRMLRHVTSAMKKTKPANPKKEKVPGESQFEKKMLVSAEMCQFAGWDAGSLKSRVDVTKVIWDYVTKHNLKTETNKRVCRPDATLAKILGVKDAEVSYPQIQKYIGKHLTKVEADA